LRKSLARIVLLLTCSFVSIAYTQDRSTEGDALEETAKLAERWQSAWNRHDTRALAALFTLDADLVNVGARHWKGRTEIEVQHAVRAAQFNVSTWSNREVHVQPIAADITLLHLSWAMSGDKDPDGTPRSPREGLFTWVVTRTPEGWLIRAAQNTNRGALPDPIKSQAGGTP
jgi:uncharacterized protein (TIGR02246 family)